MAHPHIDQVQTEVYEYMPTCDHYPPGSAFRPNRCDRPAAVWLVSPDDLAIMRVCQTCADGILAEYDAHQDVVEGKWYSVPLIIRLPLHRVIAHLLITERDDPAMPAQLLERWVTKAGPAIIGRMQAEGFPGDPAAWSDQDINNGLGGSVAGRKLTEAARAMRDRAKADR